MAAILRVLPARQVMKFSILLKLLCHFLNYGNIRLLSVYFGNSKDCSNSVFYCAVTDILRISVTQSGSAFIKGMAGKLWKITSKKTPEITDALTFTLDGQVTTGKFSKPSGKGKSTKSDPKKGSELTTKMVSDPQERTSKTHLQPKKRKEKTVCVNELQAIIRECLVKSNDWGLWGRNGRLFGQWSWAALRKKPHVKQWLPQMT